MNTRKPSRADRLAHALQMIDDILPEIATLKDELEEWRENMPENLQDSPKAYELEDAIQELETLEDHLTDAKERDVMFPGMF